MVIHRHNMLIQSTEIESPRALPPLSQRYALPRRFMPARSKPAGLRLWGTLAAVLLGTACLTLYGINTWPMADDEVPTLAELGLFEISGDSFSVPAEQIEQLPRALPVWYGIQGQLFRLLPHNQFGFRIPSVICGLVVVGFSFVFAARYLGLGYAMCLATILNGSQSFVFLAQVNRFYMMPLLFLTLTLGAIWSRAGGLKMILLTAILSTLAVLSHNIIVVVFVLGFISACIAYPFGWIPKSVLLRTAVTASISVPLYWFYLRPIVSGWHSTGNPTPVLISFASHAGIPMLALALLGTAVCIGLRRNRSEMAWWVGVFCGAILFIAKAPITWNPRYFLFFMPPMWILAAYGMYYVARRLRPWPLAVAWFAAVVLVLLPKLASHYRDGSRHDYRQAAGVVMANLSPGQPILSDDAETISYYLPRSVHSQLFVRSKAREFPSDAFLMVARSNAWMPLPKFEHRQSEVIAEIFRRRYDEFSHVLRVYRVAPDNAPRDARAAGE